MTVGLLTSLIFAVLTTTCMSRLWVTVYTLYTNPRSWYDARVICRQHAGHLINLDSKEKYEEFFSTFNHYPEWKDQIKRPWVGLFWSTHESEPVLRKDDPLCRLVEPPADYIWYSSSSTTRQYSYYERFRCFNIKWNYTAGITDSGVARQECSEQKTYICETFLYEEFILTSMNYFKLNIGLYLAINGAVQSEVSFSNPEDRLHCDIAVQSGTANAEERRDVADTIVLTAMAAIVNNEQPSTSQTTAITSTETPFVTTSIQSATAISQFKTSSTQLTTTTVSSKSSLLDDHSEQTRTDLTSNELTLRSSEIILQTTAITSTETPFVTTSMQSATAISQFKTSSTQLATTTVSSKSSLLEDHAEQTRTDQTSNELTLRSSEIILTPSPCYTTVIIDTLSTQTSRNHEFPVILGSDGHFRSRACRDVIVVSPDPTQTAEATSSIIKELSVEKKNLSSFIYKKISQNDDRSSSTAIGYVGIVFIMVPLVLILAPDVARLVIAVKDVMKYNMNRVDVKI